LRYSEKTSIHDASSAFHTQRTPHRRKAGSKLYV
jgi:hypothetical protein